AGAVPVTMGGDGSVTLPQLRAVHKRHPGLVVLHIDAHTDTYPGSGRDMYNTATTFTRAAEEGVVDTAGSLTFSPTCTPSCAAGPSTCASTWTSSTRAVRPASARRRGAGPLRGKGC